MGMTSRERDVVAYCALAGVTQLEEVVAAAGADAGALAGVTQLEVAAAAVWCDVAGASVGCTQAPEAADALVDVDCSRASRRDDATPSTGRPLACSKLAMAERVWLPA